MKKIGVFFIGIMIIGLFLNSCDDGTKEQYYYYEGFTITKTNFNSVPFPSSATFNAIKNYRNSLKNYMVDFLESGTDATENDIYSLLTLSGMTPSEANAEIKLLKNVGNNVGIFTHAYNINLYVIIYVEKL